MTATRRLAIALFLPVLAATAACAEAPATSPPPAPRPTEAALAATPPAPAGPAKAAQPAPAGPAPGDFGVTGAVGYAVIDVATGETLAALAADQPLAPASVAKAPTALYALERLGADHRFVTEVRALGPVEAGRLRGDLALVGGGDPELDSAGLAALARDAAARLVAVDGALRVEAGDVAPLIDADQPERAAYNPAVAALNLNFNRVRLRWTRSGEVALDAHSETHSPPAAALRLERTPKTCGCPAIAYAADARGEGWRVREDALAGDGSVWLPVRAPAAYAAGVFRVAAAEAGLALPLAAPAGAAPATTGTAVARRVSRPLDAMLADMLDHSTNLTAEVLGLAATTAAPAPAATAAPGGATVSLAVSAAAMNAWAAGRLDAPRDGEIAFANHSGLSAASRVSPRRMAALLAAAHRAEPGRFAALLPDHPLSEDAPKGATVRAKTGTMDFIRGLAGYAATPSGRLLAFTFLANDLDRREAAREIGERREGARAWRNRAMTLERALLADWLARFD